MKRTRSRFVYININSRPREGHWGNDARCKHPRVKYMHETRSRSSFAPSPFLSVFHSVSHPLPRLSPPPLPPLFLSLVLSLFLSLLHPTLRMSILSESHPSRCRYLVSCVSGVKNETVFFSRWKKIQKTIELFRSPRKGNFFFFIPRDTWAHIDF